ncbi:cystine transport system substrate-binding protein [Actinobaculum suis]|uniref:Cystine transport system substrate-binding protein n=1 Tax=Actinobaculum suis TaxID=1657 RepID=A0A1B9BAH5_9ACTO|nr:transporter substrate-binding domain-containing protein [Actinobaculum suis]MDY5153600.1 transporter substrate-binding domain-containing protein [Actinobaculum suis]OCA93102.1 hypothetical protein ACU21_01230 [Actinobaculum suis]OCA93533.1 hypothetical protein ACU20_01715 [Actinobaculum suis]SDE24099.1 cystine transport system substrate-binding protein [Actinobaculum suis]
MKTRKITQILAAAGAALLALTACSGNSGQGAAGTGASGDQNGDASSNTLRIGLEGTFAPYGYHDESGDLVGFEKEIADAVAAHLGRTPVYVESPWESLIAGLDNKNYEIVINNLAPTEERKLKYDFTQPYYTTHAFAAVREDSDIHTESDLAGKKCAQSASSNYADNVRAVGAEITPTSGFADSIQLVEQGRADCTANGDITLAYYLEKHPDSKLRLIEITSAPGDDTAIMLNKGNEELLGQINEALTQIKNDGTLDEIIAKYTPQNIPAANN